MLAMVLYHANLTLITPSDCGTPVPATGVAIVSFSSTNIGAVLVFRCTDGLFPSGLVTAECGANGEWNPDPANHICANTSALGTR